jgi:outer membrane protein W
MKSVSSVLLALVFTGVTYAQESDNTSKYKPLFGFNFGLNQSLIYNSNAVDELQIKNALGFRLGVFAEFPISKRWAVSPKTELSFNYGRVIINDVGYRVDPVNLDLMLHFKHKFKWDEGSKVQPFMNFGPNFRTPLNSNFEGTYLDTTVSLAADFGFGLEIDVKYFYFSPELRFSGGLTDIRKNPSGNILRGSNAVLILNFSGK